MTTMTTAPHVDKETNPWESQRARFDLAAQKLNLDEGLWRVLRYPNREVTVYIPVQMDDGHLEVFTGFRVQHSIARGPAKGGIRYAPDVTLDESAPSRVDDPACWSIFPLAVMRRDLRSPQDVDGEVERIHAVTPELIEFIGLRKMFLPRREYQ
jgi:glutamate dehydrogenase (NAD(P)+)